MRSRRRRRRRDFRFVDGPEKAGLAASRRGSGRFSTDK